MTEQRTELPVEGMACAECNATAIVNKLRLGRKRI